MSLPRAYLRIDPNLDAHPDQDAMLTLILFGNRCSERGRFRSLSMIEKILGKKRLKACLDRKDLIPISGGRYYVSGWDEWQEGDLTVGERMGRVRRRRSMSEKDLEEDDRNGGVTNTVTEPSPERITGRNSSSEALTLTLDVDGTDINPGRSVKVSDTAAPNETPVIETEEQEPTATAPRRLTPQALGIRVNPAIFTQVQLSHDLAALVPLWQRDLGSEPGDPKDLALKLLHDISTTPAGKRIETLDLRRVPSAWASVSSHAAHKLALEAYGVDLGALAMAGATPAETGPAPKTPTLSVTVAPGRCPMCDGPITHTTEAGAKVLRCLDDQGLRCDWSAVWREVAA